MIYHVSPFGFDTAKGTEEAPFRTIGRAARATIPGDTVIVHEGVYREWVAPTVGGLGEFARITFKAADGEHAVIKGSEIITDWEKVEGSVWKTVIPNSFFGSYNPYAEALTGDWFRHPTKYQVHTGEVYLNGKALYEASSLEALYKAEKRIELDYPCRSVPPERYPHPEDTVYQWFAEVDEESTTIYCNFREYDPNHELIEINVRQSCFRPTMVGIHYITVSGFEIAHGATPFNPPSAEQIGMVGPYWAKGWIIENCDIHDAKTSAVCLGKDYSTGHNLGNRFGRKSSHLYQMEAVFLAANAGWSKDTVGSHIVRNNEIHDCGENGIVGHLGCIFSRIEHNHIYNIGLKYEFWGDEIGGIKFHTPIDTVIENNNIHDCTLGMWLDWESQGTRVSRNLFYNNTRDMEVEVCHGPFTADHNLFLSDCSIENFAQGSAFVHNIIAGVCVDEGSVYRLTPYHLPHSTTLLGVTHIYSGDDRLYNNLILGKVDLPKEGTPGYNKLFKQMGSLYDKYSTPEEYIQRKAEEPSETFSLVKYGTVPQPVYINGNVYSGFATPFRAEKSYVKTSGADATVKEENGKWILTLTIPADVDNFFCEPVTTQRLGAPRITEERYENPDGTPIDFTKDFLGQTRTGAVRPGPFASLSSGTHQIVVWEK